MPPRSSRSIRRKIKSDQRAIARRHASAIANWQWKAAICREAEIAIEAAQAMPPHDAEDAWLAADRVLARIGCRYPSVALPAEFGFLLYEANRSLPREIWLLISSYTVDPSDAAAEGLENAVAARAYCLTAGNGNNSDASRLRIGILRLTVRFLAEFDDVLLRSFHTQRYDRVERIGADFLVVDSKPNRRLKTFRIAVRLNLTLTAAFRGDGPLAAVRLSEIRRHESTNGWLNIAGGWRFQGWYLLAKIWTAALNNDEQTAYSVLAELLSVEPYVRQPPTAIGPYIDELKRLLSAGSTIAAGIVDVHAKATAVLVTRPDLICLPYFPKAIFDAAAPFLATSFPILD